MIWRTSVSNFIFGAQRNRKQHPGRNQQRTIKKFPLLSKDFVVLEDKPYSTSEAESSTLPNSSASSPTPSNLLQGTIEEAPKDDSKDTLYEEVIMSGWNLINTLKATTSKYFEL